LKNDALIILVHTADFTYLLVKIINVYLPVKRAKLKDSKVRYFSILIQVKHSNVWYYIISIL